MTPGAKKQKGNKFETKIADLIHAKLLQQNPEYQKLFEEVGHDRIKPQRDASSGNFVNSHGDIDLNLAKNFFPFSIECKFWKSLDLKLNSLMNDKLASLITVWNEQALPNSIKTGLKPLIVFTANYTSDFVFYDKNKVELIPLEKFLKIDNWIICLADDFIDCVNYRMVKKLPPFEK